MTENTFEQKLMEFDRPQGKRLADDVERLKAFLTGKGFVTGRKLCRALGWNERRLRAVSSGSSGAVVSGPGCPGYALTAQVPRDEVAGVVRRLESQRAHMARRIRDLQTVLGPPK